MILVTINGEPERLGPDATPSDVERFAEALARHLSEQFDCTVHVRTGSTDRSLVDGDDHELASRVAEHLHHIERGDEWIEIARKALE